MNTPKLNEDVVKSLPIPESGNRVHYFPDAVIQGAKAPRGFGVRVTAAGVRSFVVNYTIARRERRYTIGQWPDWSVLRAVREARDLRVRIDRGEDPLDGRRKQDAAPATTLKAIAEDYPSRECGMTRDADGNTTFEGGKIRSGDQRLAAFERLVYPVLGDQQIGDIKRSDVVVLLDKIEDERGPQAAHQALAFLSKLFNWHASRSDDFRSPIVRGMARVKPRERARERTLTDDELRAVWKAAEASTAPFERMVRFILLTSARRTEAAAMAWSELNGDWTLPAIRNKTKVDLLLPLSAEARGLAGES